MLKQPEFAAKKFRQLKNNLLKRSAQWADHVITVSETMVHDMVEYWKIPQEKVSVVYNGIEDCWFESIDKNTQQHVLAKYHIEKPFILFVGTLQPRKNICRLITAYQQLPKALRHHYQLILVGREGWSTHDISNAVAKLTESGSGLWLNYVDVADVRALYQAATLFVFPSLCEGFGLPIIESFASKTPVITSNITAMPEIAGHSAWLVDPYDIEAIRHAMATLLDDPQRRQDYIKKGERRAQQFSWQQCASKTFDVYRKLSSSV